MPGACAISRRAIAPPFTRQKALAPETALIHGMGVAPFMWDPGNEFNRYTYQWSTAGLLDALLRAMSDQDYTPTLQ